MISVIIPTFNRAVYLQQAITSVLNQTFSDFEIIIIDDGSIDNTFEVIKKFNNPKIKYINDSRTKNIAKNRNKGIRASKGNFIAFCDDDDYWIPIKLELQLKLIEDYDMVCSNAFQVNSSGEIINSNYLNLRVDKVLTTETLLRDNQILTPTVLIKKDSLISERFNEIEFKNFNEDYDLWLRLSESNKIFLCNNNLAFIREHNSLTRDIENRIKLERSKIYLINRYTNFDNESVKNAAIESEILIRYYLILFLKKNSRISSLLIELKNLILTFFNPKYSINFFKTISKKIQKLLHKIK